MQSSKRNRGKNYTEQEKNLLLDCMKPYISIIECQQTTKRANEQRDEAWEEIANIFNSNNGFPRDAKSLRSAYIHYKMMVKREYVYLKRRSLETGDLSFLKKMSPTARKMLALITNQIECMENSVDFRAEFGNLSQHSESGYDTANVYQNDINNHCFPSDTNNSDETEEIEYKPDLSQLELDSQQPVSSIDSERASDVPEMDHKRKRNTPMMSSKNPKFEFELFVLNKEACIKQNQLLNKQNKIADLELEIKKVQLEYEKQRLNELLNRQIELKVLPD